MKLKSLTTRDQLGYALEALNAKVGIEIGVQEGVFSREILCRATTLETLYLCDPWKSLDDYIDKANISDIEQQKNYLQTIRNMSAFEGRYKILRMTSEEASKTFADNSLDFIYIDANHSYKYVKQDIELWWSKLKIGGVFSGHDYVPDGTFYAGEFGVKKAVDEFVNLKKLELFVTEEPYDHVPSWITLKVAE